MKIKSIELKQFKGINELKLDMFDKTLISGKNRAGKTTVLVALYWLFFGKGENLNDKPNIMPRNMENAEPMVIVEVESNGKTLKLCKFQKTKKKELEDGSVSSSTENKYFVNEVGMTEKAFKEKLKENGISLDGMYLCSCVDVFMNYKQDDMRKLLSQMAKGCTDISIAQNDEELKELVPFLENYNIEEIKSLKKAEMKKANERIADIPQQIIGKESAKVEVDSESIKDEIKTLESEIEKIQLEYNSSVKALESVKAEILSNTFEINHLKEQSSKHVVDKKQKILAEHYAAESKYMKIKSKYDKLLSEKELLNAKLDSASNTYTRCAKEYNSLKDSKIDPSRIRKYDESQYVFDEKQTVCYHCGQRLQEESIEKMRANLEKAKTKAKDGVDAFNKTNIESFEREKRNKMAKLKEEHAAANELKNTLSVKIEDIEKEIQLIDVEVKASHSEMTLLKEQAQAINTDLDFSQVPGYNEALEKHLELTEKEESLKIIISESYAQKDIDEKTTIINSLQKKLAGEEFNKNIDLQIQSLNNELVKQNQNKSNAEKILFLVDKLSKTKNNIIVDEVNSYFNIVKWKLFDYQKNGEYKEICMPTVDGLEFKDDLNNERKVAAKIDICQAFQKFFKINMPIIFDNMESVNDENIPVTDCQLIVMKVTEDEKLTVKEF